MLPRLRPDVKFLKDKILESTVTISEISLYDLRFSFLVSNRFSATCSSRGVLHGSSLIVVSSSMSNEGNGFS